MECTPSISKCRQYSEAARTARGGLECGRDEGEGADDILSMVGVRVGWKTGDEALNEGVGQCWWWGIRCGRHYCLVISR